MLRAGAYAMAVSKKGQEPTPQPEVPEVAVENGFINIRRIGIRISLDALQRLQAESIRRSQLRVSHVSISELINEAVIQVFPKQTVHVFPRESK